MSDEFRVLFKKKFVGQESVGQALGVVQAVDAENDLQVVIEMKHHFMTIQRLQTIHVS